MPLTPAHAAVAWPMRRLWPSLPLAPLVIGAVSPDFEYFLHLAPRGGPMHSLLGGAIICVPLSVAVWAFFRAFVRPVLLRLLPRQLAGAVRTERVRLVSVVAAVFLGVLTHLAWDAFTHATGWAVTAWPALRYEALPNVAPGVTWFKLLQHASTLLGSAALLAWGVRWVRTAPAESRRFTSAEIRHALRVGALILVAAAVSGTANAFRVSRPGVAPALGYAAVGALAGGAVALAGLGLWTRVIRR